MQTTTRLSEITPEHLGSAADWNDVEQFKGAVERLLPVFDEQTAMDFVWNDGQIRMHADLCADCQTVVADNTIVPDVDDDAAWAELATLHDPNGCEWVETRAHQRMGHNHTCTNCGRVIASGVFDCESDTDHDFELCDACLAAGVRP